MCTCGQEVVSGELSVLVYGNPTSQGARAQPDSPFSLWNAAPQAPQGPFGPVPNLAEPPAWAKDALGPAATWPGQPGTQPQGADLLQMSAGSLFK